MTETCAHRAWRRWELTRILIHFAYRMGMISGWGWMTNATCRGCLFHVRWRGRRTMILGAPTVSWGCVLRRHHWPTSEKVAFGMCSRCLPCPSCGTGSVGHDSQACADVHMLTTPGGNP